MHHSIFSLGSQQLPLISASERFHIAVNGKERELFARLYALAGSRRYMCVSAMNMIVLSHRLSDPQFSASQQLIYPTQAGEYIIFNGHVLHGSVSHHQPRPRVAINFRYRSAKLPGYPEGYFLFTKKKLQKWYANSFLERAGIMLDDGKIPVCQISGENCHANFQSFSVQQLADLINLNQQGCFNE